LYQFEPIMFENHPPFIPLRWLVNRDSCYGWWE
jgi:hypothetical protein